MSDPQRPEREAIEQALREFAKRKRPGFAEHYGAEFMSGWDIGVDMLCRFGLAALPPTPTPGLETWLKEREVEAVASHNAADGVSRAWWSGRVDTLRDVIALLPPAHAGGR
jgi:hypothetical protein